VGKHSSPLDDEPHTDEERAADDKAREEAKRGHVVTTDGLHRRLGS
jgi:hypothetical protein